VAISLNDPPRISLRNGGAIHTVSALMLHLVQNCPFGVRRSMRDSYEHKRNKQTLARLEGSEPMTEKAFEVFPHYLWPLNVLWLIDRFIRVDGNPSRNGGAGDGFSQSLRQVRDRFPAAQVGIVVQY
jgi:hypothetical protein